MLAEWPTLWCQNTTSPASPWTSTGVVATAHFVRVGRILVHPLLPTQLIAVVIEAPIVALLIHQVEHTLVNAPAQPRREVSLTRSLTCPKVAKVSASGRKQGKTHGHIIVDPPPGGT